MTGGRDVCGALRTYYDCDNWPVRAVPIVCYVRRRSATAMIYAKAAGDGMMSQPAQEPVGEKGIRTSYTWHPARSERRRRHEPAAHKYWLSVDLSCP